MRFLIFTATVLFAISVKVNAQSIDLTKAMERARDFYSHTPGMKKASGSQQLTLAHAADTENGTAYYVFNRNTEEGFVIVGGSENGREILGYCEGGHFDYNDIPDNMRWWLSLYANNTAEESDGSTSSMKKAAATEKEDIPELLKTKWDQSSPYNTMIPLINNKRPYTGCVATATAQVMKYHNHPLKGTGENSYTKKYNDESVTFSADFGSATYDWNNMLNVYSGVSATQAQKDAVALLMYHVGVGLNMSYASASGGSSASASTIPVALYKYFGYDKSVHEAQRLYYSDEEWENLIYNELKAGRPVIYSGRDDASKSGHEFVLHGYDANRDLWAVNWGWSGTYNGYFAISGEPKNDILRPSANTSSTSGASYSSSQSAIINCMPDKGNDTFWQITLTGSSFILYYGTEKITSINVSTNNPQLYYFTYGYNRSTESTPLYLGAAFRNIETGDMVYASETLNYGRELTPNYQWSAKVGFRTTNIIYNGEYELVPIFRRSPTDPWQIIMKPYGFETPHIYVTGRQTPTPTAIKSAEETVARKQSPEYFDIQGRRISPTTNSKIRIAKNTLGIKKSF